MDASMQRISGKPTSGRLAIGRMQGLAGARCGDRTNRLVLLESHAIYSPAGDHQASEGAGKSRFGNQDLAAAK
jgi:hypothetical protein